MSCMADVCPRGLCCCWAQSMRRAVPMQAQDQENSALLVTQGSLVHQSSPTFIGMLGPGKQSAAHCLLFFFFPQSSSQYESHVCICAFVQPAEVVTYTQILSGRPLLRTPLLNGLSNPCPVTHKEDDKTGWWIPLNPHSTENQHHKPALSTAPTAMHL